MSKKLSYDIMLSDPCHGRMLLKFLSYEAGLALYLNNIHFNIDNGSINIMPDYYD